MQKDETFAKGNRCINWHLTKGVQILLIGKAISGEDAVLTEATHFACGDAVMSDAFSRTGKKTTRATSVEGDVGGGNPVRGGGPS